ncbi:multicopper oxidase family protein [Hoyosella subflava]|nr:multicopper oxidase family protein [Hoyosella subflava]
MSGPAESSRRQFLRMLVGAAFAGPFVAGCSVTGGDQGILGRKVPGQTGLMVLGASVPESFTVPLALPSMLRPVRTVGSTDHYELTVRPALQEIVSGVETPIWGYNGEFPGPLIESQRGRRVVVHTRNELPAPVSTHLHGGRTPAADDGYPTDLLLPARGWEHGHEHSGAISHGERDYTYPLDQRAALLWYHDHRMDFTGPQVWRGLAGMHLHRDDEEAALGLPTGEYELPLMVTDRSFGRDGRFLYPSRDPELVSPPGVLPDFANGVLGDVLLVNGVPAPFHPVSRGVYRLRIVNASNARHYRFELVPGPPGREPFLLIGSDGGLLAAPVELRSFALAPSERADVLVDFSSFSPGENVVLRNRYGDEHCSDVLLFRVGSEWGPSYSAPAVLSHVERLDESQAVRTRTFHFARRNQHDGALWPIGGHLFDPDHIAAAPALGDTEIWQLSSDLRHPFHIHHVPFQVLDNPGVDKYGWKDTLALGLRGSARVIIRFDGYRGKYTFHCHTYEHEDMGMMANYAIT